MVMAYTDFPGPVLVNNLNLILKAPNGIRYVGNRSGSARLSMDGSNNVEVINVPDPLPGAWVVDVVGSNVPEGPQDFALVYTAHTGAMPATDIVRKENLTALDIPDNASQGVNSVLSISEPGLISNVTVVVDITHSYFGDLRVSLISPEQTAIVLHDRQGASTDDLVKTYDVHTTPGLAALQGKPMAGEWQLAISDHARKDVGALRRWELILKRLSAIQVHGESLSAHSIPDNDPGGIQDVIEIAREGLVHDVRVSVDITHTWIGDLKVELISPSGSAVTLHDQSGRGVENIIRSYEHGGLPALGNLVGEAAKGTWVLHVTDLAGRDVGKLNRWALELVLSE